MSTYESHTLGYRAQIRPTYIYHCKFYSTLGLGVIKKLSRPIIAMPTHNTFCIGKAEEFAIKRQFYLIRFYLT